MKVQISGIICHNFFTVRIANWLALRIVNIQFFCGIVFLETKFSGYHSSTKMLKRKICLCIMYAWDLKFQFKDIDIRVQKSITFKVYNIPLHRTVFVFISKCNSKNGAPMFIRISKSMTNTCIRSTRNFKGIKTKNKYIYLYLLRVMK